MLTTLSKTIRGAAFVAAALVAGSAGAALAQSKVAVITPYRAQAHARGSGLSLVSSIVSGTSSPKIARGWPSSRR